MLDSSLINISSEVESALISNRPIVALESTVTAHGLPRPQNLETARQMEQIVRDSGAIAATVAIIDGKFCVGLTAEQLRMIAETDGLKKVSIRDLPIAVTREWTAATTVASTVWIANRAGVKVFATGGIGGVHRGFSADVSGDLPALASTSMLVVCSGAKIVLDLHATREWLETYGVTVVGYGCDEMPAFYSGKSGLPVDVRCDSAAEVADLFRSHESLGIERALLVTVPVPQQFEVPEVDLKRTLDAALLEAEREKIAGRDLTPYLLSRMAQHSGGATLRANIALLKNNASVAAEIARALSEN